MNYRTTRIVDEQLAPDLLHIETFTESNQHLPHALPSIAHQIRNFPAGYPKNGYFGFQAL